MICPSVQSLARLDAACSAAQICANLRKTFLWRRGSVRRGPQLLVHGYIFKATNRHMDVIHLEAAALRAFVPGARAAKGSARPSRLQVLGRAT